MAEKCAEVKRLEYFLARKDARIRELEEQLDHAAYSIALLAARDDEMNQAARASGKLVDRLHIELAISRN
ncbi:hypothetical protein [Pseudomonas sp. NPDC079086]|uniref:hypothetical protein n=1 Tax=unclassified Pseudomonas TaxID=196821 RepID=UPI0037C59D13